MNYHVQVNQWGHWETVRTFSNLSTATSYGASQLRGQQWRVRTPQELASEARSQRIDSERVAADYGRPQRYPDVVAARQRQLSRIRQAERAARLRGFRFVGPHDKIPDVNWKTEGF